MPQAIELARHALSNYQGESAAHFERPAEQALALATGEVYSLSYLSVVL